MKDLKIFKVSTNNGDWGGCHSCLYIAETKEEALAISGKVSAPHYDVWVSEYKPESIYIQNKAKYDIEVTITVKEKEVAS